MVQVTCASSPSTKGTARTFFTNRGGTVGQRSNVRERDTERHHDGPGPYPHLRVPWMSPAAPPQARAPHGATEVEWGPDAFYSSLPSRVGSPCTRILPSVLALPAALAAKHMYWPESVPVRLSRMRAHEPSGSSMRMWCGSTSTGFPSAKEGRALTGGDAARDRRLAYLGPQSRGNDRGPPLEHRPLVGSQAGHSDPEFRPLPQTTVPTVWPQKVGS